MTALAKDRNTPHAEPGLQEFPVLAAAKIFAGSIAVLDSSGWAKPGVTGTDLVVVGRAEQQVDNTDSENGDLKVRVRPGVYRWANSTSSDEITKAEIGDNCYLVDDQTVAKLSTGRSVAGRIEQVDADGVWVATGVGVLNAPGGAALTANNLSDMTAATAFGNIKQAATTSATGVSELATSAETITGTDTARTVTPAGAAAAYKHGTPSFVIGAEGSDVINVGIQLKDGAGADLAVRGSVLAYFSDDANGDSVAATAFDTVAIGTDGLAIPLDAGKTFLLTSEADGDIDLNVTENAAVTKYLILVMPDGKLVSSGAITFA